VYLVRAVAAATYKFGPLLNYNHADRIKIVLIFTILMATSMMTSNYNMLATNGDCYIITHANVSRVSIAIIRLCDSVCDSVRTIKPKRLKI